MINGTLRSQVDKIWNTFWTGGISNPLSVIEQFTFLLFMRRLDEQQTAKEKKANFIGKQLEDPIFEEKFFPFRWSQFKNLDPEQLFDLFKRPSIDGLTVFDHMKNMGAKGGVFGEFMKDANFLIGNARLLDQVVQLIDKLEIEDKDSKGDLYEYMLSKIASAGTNGQFRTPRHIIKMMVEMVEPKQDDTICDPSSGTAGFLVASGEYINEKHNDWFTSQEFRDHYNNHMFHGVEFDPTMVRIGAMNLQLHGITNPTLISTDALSEGNTNMRDQFSLVLANPPFTGSLDYDGVEKSILQTVKTKKTELLFLGLILRSLKTGGRAAVIVPQGVQFGSSKAHKSIRQEIVERQKLDAVISLPSGVFKPYAGVSTAILIFTKTESGGTDHVWFYDLKNDGYSLDDKRVEIKDSDIPDVLERWKNKEVEHQRERTQQSFMVPFKEIKANDWDLSINRYKDVEYEEIEYAAPKDIIAEIEMLEKEKIDSLNSLKRIINGLG